jgi:hypothetical protein
MLSIKEIELVKNALSIARISTYENVKDNLGDKITVELALDLYAWNAQVSAALLAPLHICEVVTRNAVADVLEAQYGDKWPWSPGFEQSLPNPMRGFSPRKDLLDARKKATTTGKVIPELKFAFWQRMFTGRHDARLWNNFLAQTFPNLPAGQSVKQSRQLFYDDLERIRLLRNRIAHHEPIFSRNLSDDFQKVSDLIKFRCQVTADWMLNTQQAMPLITACPISKIDK